VRLNRRYVIGVLVVAVLYAGYVGYMSVMQDGPDDPPPIIVSNGGSILVGYDASGAYPGAFKEDAFGTWYYQPSSHQYLPKHIEITVVGAKDASNNDCATYATDKKIVFEYGSGSPQPTFEATIGVVPELIFWSHLKFEPKGNHGKASGNAHAAFTIDSGQAVYLKTVRIQPNSGPNVTCTFQSTSTDPKVVGVSLQQRHN
jgi:hypothetical protein